MTFPLFQQGPGPQLGIIIYSTGLYMHNARENILDITSPAN